MSIRRKLAIASWGEPSEGNIYGKLTVDMTRSLRYLEELRGRSGEKVTVTHLVGKAIAEALRRAPTLNGRIRLGEYIPFDTVDIAFLVALEGGNDLAKAKVCDVDKKSIVELAHELADRTSRLRGGGDNDFEKSKGAVKALPTWILRPVVAATGFLASSIGLTLKPLGIQPFPFGSCIITNVGMFGVDEAFVPPTPFARVPLYVLIGAVREHAVVKDGQIVAQKQLTITATIDHRFIDGAQLAVLAKTVRSVLEDPWQLDGPGQAPAPDATAQPKS
ncbi:MAG TPA: 2-oxo acid dehydrogenase subunit E2 [Pseudomonadota bacterium]|nr:2-oxo acid dehydrogenase subunit E2 [Pseudomonadota bacterium]